jgi:SAM-dependent methyltransferase
MTQQPENPPRLAVADGLVEVPCPLCHGTEHAEYVWAPSHYGPEKYRVTRCAACRMIYTNPQPVSYLQEVSHRGVLDRHFRPSKLTRLARVAMLVLSILAPQAAGRRVLDFGCGEGTFVATAVDAGWDAVGTDLNAGLVQAANRHWGFDRLHAGSLDEFAAAAPAPFDVIVSSQVFEHLQRPVETGRKLVELLRPGGLIYIDVPNANQLQEWVSKGKTLDPTAHWNHFTVDTLRDLVRRMDCEVVSATGAPSLVNVYHDVGAGSAALPLARMTRKVLPNVGSGACVIGRKPPVLRV